MQICTLTLLVAIYGSVGIHATDLHRTYPHHNDALLNGPQPLLDHDSFMDSSSSDHDASRLPSGLYDDHPDSSGLESPSSHSTHDIQQEPISNNFPNDPPFSPVVYSHPDSLASLGFHNNIRAIRDASSDKAHEFLNHTAIVAHIANGIALQSGLMSGKIKIDDLIGELLNFGSAAVSDIANFKSDKVVALTNKMKGLAGSLDSSKDVEDMEAKALAWNDYRIKSAPVSDIAKFPSTDDYFTAVDTIPKMDPNSAQPMTFDFELFDGIRTDLNHAEAVFGQIDRMLSTKTAAVKGASFVGQMQELFDYSANYTSKLKILNSEIQRQSSVEILMNPSAVFGPLETAIHLIENRLTRGYFAQDATIQLLSKNLNVVLGLKSESAPISQEMSKIDNLAKSRSSPLGHSKKLIPGFPNGMRDVKQLAKDVRDPWLGKILNQEGSNLNGLTDGLQPLFKLSDKLARIDDKLNPITSSEFHDSLLAFGKLQKTIANLASDSPQSVSVFQEYEKCAAPPKPVPVTYNTVKKLLDEVNEYKAFLIDAVASLKKANADEMKTAVTSFFSSLKFKNLSDAKQSIVDAPEVLTQLKQGDTWKNFKKLFTDSKAFLGKKSGKDLKTLVFGSIAKGKNTINHSSFDTVFKGELDVFACLQKLSAQAEKVSAGIQAVQKLRVLDTREMEEVERAVSSISSVSKDLVGVRSTSDSLKKEAKLATEKINEFPDSEKNSNVIGQSVKALLDAHALTEMESDIAQLKQFQVNISSEIQKISNPNDRDKVENQWGKSAAGIGSLEKSIADVKSFDSKLDLSKAKTLSDYSSPLKGLATISDSNINAIEMSQALEFLIAQPKLDPNVKPDLVRSKETLDKLSTLDLAFSSHQAQFNSAPGAFKAVEDFLVSFLKEDYSVVVETGGSSLLIPMAVAIIAIFLLGGVGGGFFYYRHRFWKFIQNNRMWVAKEAQKKYEKLLEVMDAYVQKQKEEKRLQVASGDVTAKPPLNKHRYKDIPCNPDTQVQVAEVPDGIHANWVKTRKGRVFIATQAPLTLNKEKGKVDTQIDFYHMVWEYAPEFIVSCCPDSEIKAKKCSQYYPKDAGENIELGPYKITTTSMKKLFNGTVEMRTLKVERDETSATVTHFIIADWPDMGVPPNHESAFAVMNMVKNSKKPIIVHCSAGVGRTISFIGLQLVYEEVMANPSASVMEVLVKMRDARWCGIQKHSQLMWVTLGIWLRLIKKFKFNMEPYTTDINVMLATDFHERYEDPYRGGNPEDLKEKNNKLELHEKLVGNRGKKKAAQAKKRETKKEAQKKKKKAKAETTGDSSDGTTGRSEGGRDDDTSSDCFDTDAEDSGNHVAIDME